MASDDARAARIVRFTAADRAMLVGDLAVPMSPRCGGIVCHPHPLYGGDRFNTVVRTVADALGEVQCATLCFDFRSGFDHGRGERLDAEAALTLVADEVGDVPLVAVGYSFGAMVVASLADPRVRAQVLIAPPIGAAGSLDPPRRPTLILVPVHDQFAPPAVVAPIIEAWQSDGAPVEWEPVESTDHSITGRAGWVGERTAIWTKQRSGSDPGVA